MSGQQNYTAREVRTIQARDLPAFETAHLTAGYNLITVMVDGRWREVLDMWDGTTSATSEMGERDDTAIEIDRWTSSYSSPLWVMARYIVEETSSAGEVSDALARWRTCDLIQVQVPVSLTIADKTTDTAEG